MAWLGEEVQEKADGAFALRCVKDEIEEDGVHLGRGGAILFTAFLGRPTAHQTDGRSHPHPSLAGTSAAADTVVQNLRLDVGKRRFLPPERLARQPHLVQGDCNPACKGNARLREAAALRNLHCPRLHRRPKTLVSSSARATSSGLTRSNRQAGSYSTRARFSGWLCTFTSRHTVPVSSTMQIAVSFTES